MGSYSCFAFGRIDKILSLPLAKYFDDSGTVCVLGRDVQFDLRKLCRSHYYKQDLAVTLGDLFDSVTIFDELACNLGMRSFLLRLEYDKDPSITGFEVGGAPLNWPDKFQIRMEFLLSRIDPGLIKPYRRNNGDPIFISTAATRLVMLPALEGIINEMVAGNPRYDAEDDGFDISLPTSTNPDMVYAGDLREFIAQWKNFVTCNDYPFFMTWWY
jgi:hypothetical protein